MHRLLPAPGRCAVLGVLNVTPNSFSDGGRYLNQAAAVEHAVAMHRRGADMIDVGGESTRPGSDRAELEDERERVLPVLTELVAAGVPVSVDTTRARLAEEALTSGATLINDVSGGQADPEMARVMAAADVPWVLMHWRGHSKSMDSQAVYENVLGEVRAELLRQVDSALAAGVDAEAIVLDPGVGFAKTGAQNWMLLQRLPELVADGFPVLMGASRKRFLGTALAGADGEPRAPQERDVATATVSALSAAAGVWGVRVHEVGSSLDAVTVAAAWQAGAAVTPFDTAGDTNG